MIAHFDLDSFFASVELLKDPTLRGKPVIVGGDRERGIVTTCTYEARKFGIHSAMSMKVAIRLCPTAIIIPGNYSDYVKYSKWVTHIIAESAPLFEKASIDEFYVDLGGMDIFFDPLQWTIALREKIIKKTGLPISFGIGKNKLVAKMATNEAKPNGFLQVPLGKEKEFLAALSVDKIPGVGEHAKEILNYHGFHFIGDIHKSNSANFEKLVGSWGASLYQQSLGIHSSVLSPYRESKSISNENTFEKNTSDLSLLMKEMVQMVEKICFSLRSEGKLSSCVAVKIKYADFSIESKQSAIPATSADDEVLGIAKILFDKLYKKGRLIRLLGVKISNLTNDTVQTNLFQNSERKNVLYKAIDEVKNRFGSDSVHRASGH
jgi:DNA polymerase-4